MTMQAIGRPDGQATMQPPEAILFRIDGILRELQELRQIVERYPIHVPEADMVVELAGSLGPGSTTELEEFNTFDVTWQRFIE